MDKWFGNKNVLRIVALGLATLLWVVVHLDQQSPTAPQNMDPLPRDEQRMINDVQVTPVGLEEGRTLIQSLDPEYINIIVKGPSEAVNQVSPRDEQSQIILNLSGLEPGTYEDIPLESVGFPKNVQVDMYPASVKVVVEEFQRKEIPIEVVILGEPEEGLRAGEPTIQPRRAYVTMPSSQLHNVTSARVEVDITGAESMVSVEKRIVAIDASGAEMENILLDPVVAQIEVPITMPFKTVPLRVPLTGQTPEGYSVALSELSVNEVTVYASDAVLDRIDFYNMPAIDVSGWISSREIDIPLPLQDNISGIHPEEITMQLDIVSSSYRTMEDVQLTLRGQNEQADTTIVAPQEGTMDMTIEGAENILETVTAEDVAAIVDVSNLPPGNHEVEIDLILPSLVKYGGEDRLIATVEIRQESDVVLEETDLDVDGEVNETEIDNENDISIDEVD